MKFSTVCTNPSIVSCDKPLSHQFLQRWSCVQQTLMPELKSEMGALTPKLERLIHVLEWVRIEEFVQRPYGQWGRPAHERAWLANAFVAKALLGLPNTTVLIERLHMDRSLRRICGFALCKHLPSESTFSRHKVRTGAERTNARLKEEFGADNVMVTGADNVMSYLMFGLLVLSADQLMRLRQ